jgi:hypothetical protein
LHRAHLARAAWDAHLMPCDVHLMPSVVDETAQCGLGSLVRLLVASIYQDALTCSAAIMLLKRRFLSLKNGKEQPADNLGSQAKITNRPSAKRRRRRRHKRQRHMAHRHRMTSAQDSSNHLESPRWP